MGHAQLPPWSGDEGVKCHGTQPASLHGLAIKGAQCHGTLPTFYHGQSIQVVKFRY